VLQRAGFLERVYQPHIRQFVRAHELGQLVAQPAAVQAVAPGGAALGGLVQQLVPYEMDESRALTLFLAPRTGFWLSDLVLPLNLASILLLFRYVSGTRPYQLGLTTHRFGKNVLLGLMTTLCIVPLVYVILQFTNWLLRVGTGEAPQSHPITLLILSRPPPVDFVVAGLAALVAAPLWEEFLFRGVIQPWLRAERWGGYVAIAAA